MPTVPDYGAPKVQEQGLPNIRVEGDVPLQALGAGPTSSGLVQAQQGLGDAIQKEIVVQQQKADQIVDLDFKSKLAAFETELLHGKDGRGGALSTRGLNALGVPESSVDTLKKYASNLASKYSTSSQRENAANVTSGRVEAVRSSLLSHAASESEKHDDDVTQSFIKNIQNAAIMSGKTKALDHASREIMFAVSDYGDRKGMNEEQKIDLASHYVSKLYAGGVTDLLNKGAYKGAKYLYDSKIDSILPEDRRNLEGAVKEGDLRSKTQEMSDKIFAKYPDKGIPLEDGSTAQGEIDELTKNNPELRKSLNADLDYRYQQARLQEKAAADSLLTDQALTSIQSQPLKPAQDACDPVTWDAMPESDQKVCEAYANPPKNPNDLAWANFMNDLSTGKAIRLDYADFVRDHASKMSISQRTSAEGLWKQAREDATNPGKDSEYASTLSVEDRAKQSALSVGLVPPTPYATWSKQQKIDFGNYQQQIDKQLQYFTAANKRKPTSEETQEIVDKLAVSRVKKDRWFFADELSFSFQDTYESMTPDQISQAAAVLSKNNVSITKENIENLYRSALKQGK